MKIINQIIDKPNPTKTQQLKSDRITNRFSSIWDTDVKIIFNHIH